MRNILLLIAVKILSCILNGVNFLIYRLTDHAVFREILNHNLLHICPVKRGPKDERIVHGLSKTYEIFSGRLYLQGVWKDGHKIGMWQYYAQGVKEQHDENGYLTEYWKEDAAGTVHIQFPDPQGNGTYEETRTGEQHYLYRRKYACRANKPFGVGLTYTQHGQVLIPQAVIDINFPNGKIIFHDISKLPESLANDVIARWEKFFEKYLVLSQNPQAAELLFKEAATLLGPARDQLQNAFPEIKIDEL